MADASHSDLPRRAALGVLDTWRRLNFEQRLACVAALLLVVSTFGPFSWVEAAIVLTGLAILLLLRRRAEGREFHIPFGDGSVIAAAGAWCALLIVFRLPERPLGQSLLALVCAGLLLIAGVAERRKRPPDDLPGPAPEAHQRGPEAVDWEVPTERLPRRGRRSRVGPSDAPTETRRRRRRSSEDDVTQALPREKPESATQRLPREEPSRTESQQLELEPAPPVNEPLPPPEFHLPGEDEEPPAPPRQPSDG